MSEERNSITLKYIKEGDICAEIGVWKGHLSKKILEKQPKKLHLIDPWVHQDVIERYYSITQERMDAIYEDVKKHFGFLDNVKIHRKFSLDVNFPEKYFNWVYVDGDHSYDAVKKDLEFYYSLIKPEGYLCGDDYGLWSNRPKSGFGSDGNGGPKPAVDEFVESYNLKLRVYDNQYVIFV